MWTAPGPVAIDWPRLARVMTTAFLGCLAATLAALLGGPLRRWLASGGHRRPTDEPRPLPRFGGVQVALGVGAGVPAGVLGESARTAGEHPLHLTVSVLLAGTLLALAVTACAVDLDVHRLPNDLTRPMALVAAGGAALLTLPSGDLAGLGRALVAGTGLAAAYLLLSVLTRGGIGLGDVKLALPVGTVLGLLGWAPVLLGTWIAFGLGALAATVLMLRRRATRSTHLAFGPAMTAGAWLVWVLWLPGSA